MEPMQTEKLEYQRFLNYPQWEAKRRQILQRDHYRCRNCGSGKRLQVHHRQYHICTKTGGWKKPWDYPAHYLVTLCDTCHGAGHKKYKIAVFHTH